jgi:hypothetical protein
LLALLGAPVLARRALVMWRSATERVCDGRAAAEVDAAAVASALVALARVGNAPAVGVAFASPAGVVERVEALLAPLPTGELMARRIARGLWLSLTACALAAALFADPLHHALETLLGVF